MRQATSPLQTERVCMLHCPPLRAISQAGGKAILMSPSWDARKASPRTELSLTPVAKYLGTKLEMPVHFAQTTVGAKAQKAIHALSYGGVLLLENTRFHPGRNEERAGLCSRVEPTWATSS